MAYKLLLIVVLAFTFSSCDIDKYLFNTKTLDTYNLSNAVIPD